MEQNATSDSKRFLLADDEFARSARNWKASLRSTGYWDAPHEDKDVAITCSDLVISEIETQKKMAENSQWNNDENNVKIDIAEKAKAKFLENLHRFQQKTAKENLSPFQRSYRRSGNLANTTSKSFRRSHRVSTGTSHRGHHSRSSLRKKSDGDVFLHDDIAGRKLSRKVVEKRSSDHSKQSSDAVVLTPAKSNDSRLSNATLDTTPPTLTSSQNSMSTFCTNNEKVIHDGPLAPTSVKPFRSNSQVEVEKHQERTRKASASNTAVTRLQSNPETKLQATQRNDEGLPTTQDFRLPATEELRRGDSSDNWREISFMDNSPLKAIIDMLSNDFEAVPKVGKRNSESSAALPGQGHTLRDDTLPFSEFDQRRRDFSPAAGIHSFEAVDANFPKSKNKNFKEESKSPDRFRCVDWTSTDQEELNSARKHSSSLVDIATDEIQEYPLKNTELKLNSFSTTSNQIVGFDQFAAATNDGPEVVTSGSTSKNLSFESRANDSAINYNVEEAIDTFKRLSQEIDLIKVGSLRQSVSETNFRPNPSVFRPQFISLSLPTNSAVKTVSKDPKSIVSDPESKKLLEKQQEICLSIDNQISGNSSLSGEIQEKERNKKLKRKERDKLIGEKTVQASKSSHLLHEGAREQKSLKSFEQKVLKNYNFSEAEAVILQNIKESKPESSVHQQFFMRSPSDVDQISENLSPVSSDMSFSIRSPPVKSGSSSHFRKMSSAKRREKLREVVMRHRSNRTSSDSDSSLFSDASSDASDIDMDWLDDGETEESVFSSSSEKKAAKKSSKSSVMKKESLQAKTKQKAVVSNGSLTNGHNSNTDRGDSPPANVGNMMAMWETKAVESKKTLRSTPTTEIDGIRGSLNEVKAVFSGPKSPKSSPAVRQRRRLSFEKHETENGLPKSSENEPVKVGSMLSVWENKKEKQTLACKAAADDEAFASSTIGRLKGAKALFENMTKQNSYEVVGVRSQRADGTTSPKSAATPVHSVKSLFENKSHQREALPSPASKRTRKELASTKSLPVSTDQSSKQNIEHFEPSPSRSRKLRDDSQTDDIYSLRSSSSLDISEKPQTTTTAVKSGRRRRREATGDQRFSDRTRSVLSRDDETRQDINRRKQRLGHQDKESKMDSSVEVAAVQSTSPTKSLGSKSNVQSKIAARRKRERRPMTQPVTVEDVTSAKQLVHSREPSSDHSSKESESQEEEQVSFSERLEYFNQIIARSKAAEPENNLSGRRHRSSTKRYLTQPVDREAVAQAKELQRNHQATQLVTSHSEQGFANNLSASSNNSDNSNGKSGSDLNVERVKKSVSETEVAARPKKVGKLASELRTKFVENQLNSLPAGPKTHRSPRPIRREISSDASSNSSSSASLHRPLRDSSSSPLPGIRSRFEEDTSSENSDMGKTRETEIKATGSIHDRLKLLEKNKEEGWKKKLKEEHKSVKSSLGDRLNKLQDSEDKWKKNKPNPLAANRSSSGNKTNISDRLNSILTNSENWKSKIGKQNDATQFTVQAKIAKKDGQQLGSVANYSVKRKTQPSTVTDEPVVTINDVTSDTPGLNKLSEVLKLSQKGLEPEVLKTTESSTTEIPDMVDEDFENFFSSNLIENHDLTEALTNGDATSDLEPTVETHAWFNDDIKLVKANNRLNDIGRLKANVKRPTARNKRTSRNPVKALAARTDVKQSYTEHRSNVSKLEQQRIASRHGFGANFTAGALAGLAAKADLSKVNLRSTKKTQAFSASDHKPWKDKMLLRVKGRRHVQTRLVEPSCSSLNSGDAFLLILPDKLFAWFGEFSNVIEKAKVNEIADYIIHKGDMGSKATSLITIKEESSSSFRTKEFWNYLDGKGDIEPSGGAEEDELYEMNAEATIKSYKFEESKLVPHKESWGKLPTMQQLSATSTYVFDFGSEMYIWQGKEVSFEDRQLAVKLAKALWDQGYDYTEIGFCPFLPASKSITKLKGPRPEWGLFARVNENLETALVQEKFEDWSNIAREIGDRDEILKVNSRGQLANEMNVKTNITPDMTSCDVKEMKENRSKPLPLQLEGYNLWKGHGLLWDEDGRGLQVVTNSVDMWHASDKALTLLNDEQKGIFHRGETYVIRWRYALSSTGKWKAEGAAAGDLKNDPKGRERIAYFLWTGCDSTVNEKGASALMATEIDKEVGSQVVITEGKEPPSMVQCFNGEMMVVDGKQGSREGFYSWRLFCVRGSCKEEGVLYQVPCHVTSLRSRTSFIAVHGRQAKVVVWHGAKSPEQTRDVAAHAAAQIQKAKRSCVGFRPTCKYVSVDSCEEEGESSDFNEAIGRMRRSKYLSLAGIKFDNSPLPRMWHLFPHKDEFVAKEFHPVAKAVNEEETVINCFPHIQQQLKELNRPALVLLDNADGVYLWESCCDEELSGSSKRQYDISRRLAMETAQDYCKHFRSSVSPLLIHENHEPIEFSNSFPIWKEPNKKILFEEKRLKKPQPIDEVLKTICRLTYSLEELRASPLPEGVDPNHLETYLSVSDFIDLFQMSKKEFYSLPPWKQQNLRKEKNLF